MISPSLRILAGLDATIRLDQTDLDFDQGVIHIRESKFGKSRLVPVHASTMARLQAVSPRL